MASRPRVVLVGFGFAGLNAGKRLARTEVDVLIVDRRNYFLFTPLMYQVATAGLERDSVSFPIRALFRKAPNVDYLMGTVDAVDEVEKRVRVGARWIAYDYLIVAAGATTNFFGNTSFERASLGMKDLGEAEFIRNTVLSNFEAATRTDDPELRKSLMTVIVVGGGPTGVEMAGALSELISHPLRKDFSHLPMTEARVVLVEAIDTILPTYSERMRLKAIARLQKMGVEVLLGRGVQAIDGPSVTLSDGTAIRSRAVVWTAGVKGAGLGSDLATPGRAGRIAVTPDLQLPEHREVFVVGDLALATEPNFPDGHPMVAPVAMQQGDRAARNILATVRGREMKPFRYHDSGQLATIGRRAAVAELRHVKLSGFPAWATWLAIHLVRLIGFRNKLVVLVNWAYNYLTYERGIRMIVEPAPPHSDREENT